MNTQNNQYQDDIKNLEKNLTHCLLGFDYFDANKIYSKIRHIKENLLNQPQEDNTLQEILVQFCSDAFDYDDIYLRGRIGTCFLYGNGVEQNEEIGVKMLKYSSNLNCMTAYHVLDSYFKEKMEKELLKNLKKYPEIYSEGVDDVK